MIEVAQVQAFNAAEFIVFHAAASEVLTRRGDGVMCVRFWGEITRGDRPAARQHWLTRAFHAVARSHHPITSPRVMVGGAKLGSDSNSGHWVNVKYSRHGNHDVDVKYNRHCERSEAIHDFRAPGLPRYARSDANHFISWRGFGAMKVSSAARSVNVNSRRHCERSEAIHALQTPGLPRCARSDVSHSMSWAGLMPINARPATMAANPAAMNVNGEHHD